MLPALICTVLDIGLPLLTAVFAAIQIQRHPRNRHWEYFFLTSLAGFFFGVPYVLLVFVGKHFTYRVDVFAYRFDAAFGEPSFLLGCLMAQNLWLNIAARMAYSLISSAVIIVASAYFLFRPLAQAVRIVRTLFCSMLFLPFYLVVPISGPRYVFSSFPQLPAVVPRSIHLTAPPNGFPSGHMIMALLVLTFAWGGRMADGRAGWWWAGRLLASVFAALTVVATLGTGEHYLLDLFAALPFTALTLWLGGGDSGHVQCDPESLPERLSEGCLIGD